MIIYALISKADGTVLVEATTPGAEGNFPQVTLVLLERLRINSLIDPILPEGSSRTFVYRADDATCWNAAMEMFPTSAMCFPKDEFDIEERNDGSTTLDNYFHVTKSNGVVYLCIADDINRRHAQNFSFLEIVKSEFTLKYPRSKITKAKAYEMDKVFSSKLKLLMHNHNTNQTTGSSQSISALNAQIDDLKQVLGQNIELILKRGDNLQLLAKKSEEMLEDASVFAKKGRNLKRTQKRHRNRMNAYIAAGVLVIIYLISISICGPFYGRCKKTDSTHE